MLFSDIANWIISAETFIWKWHNMKYENMKWHIFSKWNHSGQMRCKQYWHERRMLTWCFFNCRYCISTLAMFCLYWILLPSTGFKMHGLHYMHACIIKHRIPPSPNAASHDVSKSITNLWIYCLMETLKTLSGSENEWIVLSSTN